jgi:hypothetical protein
VPTSGNAPARQAVIDCRQLSWLSLELSTTTLRRCPLAVEFGESPYQRGTHLGVPILNTRADSITALSMSEKWS